jgi:2-dehydropantoate 2-reductase
MTRALIYGAGAIGSFIGFILASNQAAEGPEGLPVDNVALLGRKGHIEEIKANGLRVDLNSGIKTVKFRNCFSSLSELGSSDFAPDLAIICVKTHSLQKVRDDLAASCLLAGKMKSTTFILLMNGMGNRDIFNLPLEGIFEGITSIGVVLSKDGMIDLNGMAKTVMEDGISPEIKEFLRLGFARNDLEIEFVNEFRPHQWNKLFVNSVINPVTALTGGHNGIVLCEQFRGTIVKIVEECVEVARKEGVDAEVDAILEFVRTVASKTSMNTSSMLSDITNRKKTEIESINGYVVRTAKKHDISVPVNETLYALVKAIESRYLS